MNDWIVVMAAGCSTRMQKNKLLLPICGEAMVCRVVRTALNANPTGVLVVFNHEQPEVAEELYDFPIRLVANHSSSQGMSTSLRLGVNELINLGADHAVVVLADQPTLHASVIRQVMAVHRETGAWIVQARYQDNPGHPVSFGRCLFPELLDVTGDVGGRSVIHRHQDARVFVDIPAPLLQDIDTEYDYRRLTS